MNASTQKLIQALEAENDPKLKPIIEKARNNTYNEFKTHVAFPIRQLVEDLRAAEHEKLAQRAINGEFDATTEEANELAASSEGQAVFAELITKPFQKQPKPKGFG